MEKPMNEKGYFKLGKDVKGVFNEEGFTGKAKSGGKFIAKLGFNAGKFAVTDLPKAMLDKAEKNKSK